VDDPDLEREPRSRFEEKADLAGFHGSARWRPDLVGYSLDTLALIWPEEAHTFKQITIDGTRIKDFAANAGVSVRTIHRRLAGHQGKPGAEDWLLITLQLYLEADAVYPGGANALRDCFLTTDRDELQMNSCLRVFFLTLLAAAAGGDVRQVLDTLPWSSPNSPRVLAWPCHGQSPPLESSLLPGLLAVLLEARSIKDRLRFALFCSFFAENESEVWHELLTILNTGGCRTVAERGRISQDDRAQAESNACLLLNNQAKLGTRAPVVQYGLLGLLALTPLSWTKLCACVKDGSLLTLNGDERLRHCSQRYLHADL
jgi:hypothetical protein